MKNEGTPASIPSPWIEANVSAMTMPSPPAAPRFRPNEQPASPHRRRARRTRAAPILRAWWSVVSNTSHAARGTPSTRVSTARKAARPERHLHGDSRSDQAPEPAQQRLRRAETRQARPENQRHREHDDRKGDVHQQAARELTLDRAEHELHHDSSDEHAAERPQGASARARRRPAPGSPCRRGDDRERDHQTEERRAQDAVDDGERGRWRHRRPRRGERETARDAQAAEDPLHDHCGDGRQAEALHPNPPFSREQVGRQNDRREPDQAFRTGGARARSRLRRSCARAGRGTCCSRRSSASPRRKGPPPRR